jgi:hypothetical protein
MRLYVKFGKYLDISERMTSLQVYEAVCYRDFLLLFYFISQVRTLPTLGARHPHVIRFKTHVYPRKCPLEFIIWYPR